MDAPNREIANNVTDCRYYPRLTDENAEKRHTILLVEDEDFVRRVACEILRDAGYRVITAKKSSEALLTYEQQNVELLLTDVVLPGENGRILAQKIRRTNPSIKVLLMTGYAEQMGPDLTEPEEFLSKPFASRELLGRVARLLGSEVKVDGVRTDEIRTDEAMPDNDETGEIGVDEVGKGRKLD